MNFGSLLGRIWGQPDRGGFARLLVEAMQGDGLHGSIEFNDDEFKLVLADDAGEFALEGLYDEYCTAAPWQRPGVIQRFLQTTHRGRADLPADWESAKGNLLPVVRDALLYEALALEMEADGSGELGIPTRPLAGRLCIGLVYDWPDSMCSIAADQLQAWGVDFDTALEVACDNLFARTDGGLEQVCEGLYVSRWQDSYDCARVLLPSVYRDLSVRGDVVAFLPNRDCLLITGTDEVEGLTAAAEIVEEQLAAPRPISAIPLRGHHLTWEEFVVAEDHPCASVLRRQRAQELTGSYDQQQKLLEPVFAARGEEVHVANYLAMHDPDTDRIFSYSVWSRGLPTLLPRTDEVILVEHHEGEEDCRIVARLRWQDLAAMCTDLTTDLGYALPRFRVVDFPADEEALTRLCLEIG